MRLAIVWLLGTFLAPGLLAETRPASQPGEPVIRVMGEGDDQYLVEEVVDEIVEALTEAAA